MLQFDRRIVETYEPVMPPDLLPGESVGFDFEYKPDIHNPCFSDPFSVAVYSGERQEGWYLPWKHLGGGNLPQESVVRWLQTNLKDRTVHGTNTKTEAHMLYQLGLDPEQLKVNFTDIAFNAALLNENRYSGFSLESLCEEYLPENERKVHPGLDADQFWVGHSSEVAERCVSDARQAYLVHAVTWPKIIDEGLDKAWTLENRCILPTVSMERTGALIDRPKLEKWVVGCDQLLSDLSTRVFSELGFGVNPDRPKEMRRAFAKLSLPVQKVWKEAVWTKKDGLKPAGMYESFDDEALLKTPHPTVQLLRKIRKLKSLKNKYLLKYLNAIDSNNVLRYQLHQLRTDADDGEGGTRGTVTGRYSCGGGEYSVNIQQVWKAELQAEMMGDAFILRELFIPEPGRQMGASDASGIEFRLFGHFAKSEFITETYRREPRTDFHMMVTKMLKPDVTDPDLLKAYRKHMKHLNFAQVYGVGRPKVARKLGLECTCPFDWDKRIPNDRGGTRLEKWFGSNHHHYDDCSARKANDIIDEYEEKFPEARALLKKAGDLAKTRGYVMTILKRRRRYPDGKRLHSAFNAIDQGSAAEYFKVKLCELFENRKALNITLRIPKHDEEVYDIDPDPVAKARVQAVLDYQSWPELRVPLLWDSGFGANWAEANGFGVPEKVEFVKQQMEDARGWIAGLDSRYRGAKQ